jgi:1-deoxy-D-xylulose-5-phosphate reductoisomerase
MKMSKRVVVLGATGSIGSQTLDIVRKRRNEFAVAGLSAHTNKTRLLALAEEFSCGNTALTGDGDALEPLIERSGADIVVNGVSGAAGLSPSICALEHGMTLALANKETIVMAGALIKKLAALHNAALIPVDSEHSALFHLIGQLGKNAAESVVLTASGGPFRTRARETFEAITPDDALAHPTWNMGKKITIDSATLANKGLEVIEAAFLFDMPPEKIRVAIHPQSMVHSLVTAKDGVLYAQISKPDMRHPILNALAYPEFAENDFEKLDIARGFTELTFTEPRWDDFPMLGLAFEAVRAGQAACIAYNAANEIAVGKFLRGEIKFTQFDKIVRAVIERFASRPVGSFDAVFALDKEARDAAMRCNA